MKTTAAEFAALTFHVPPSLQVAYACDTENDRIVCRTTDRSREPNDPLRGTVYHWAPIEALQGDFEPWNSEPEIEPEDWSGPIPWAAAVYDGPRSDGGSRWPESDSLMVWGEDGEDALDNAVQWARRHAQEAGKGDYPDGSTITVCVEGDEGEGEREVEVWP